MDSSFRQEINKETQALNNTIDQTKWMFTGQFKQPEYILLKCAKEHPLGYITSSVKNQVLVSLRKLQSYPNIVSDHNTEIRNQLQVAELLKNRNTWRLKNMLLSNQKFTRISKRKLKKI